MIEYNLQYNSISNSWEVTTNEAFATKELAQEWIQENTQLKELKQRIEYKIGDLEANLGVTPLKESTLIRIIDDFLIELQQLLKDEKK